MNNHNSFDDLLKQSVSTQAKKFKPATDKRHIEILSEVIREQQDLLKKCLAGLREYRELQEASDRLVSALKSQCELAEKWHDQAN
jgi:hypothetical protein